jgi:aryl-alcohol dehydrogenase-like predicted oxidoreductase
MWTPAGALRLGLGTMRLEGEGAVAVLHRALDGGIRLFDTADVYGSDAADPGANERILGKALKT